MNVTLIGKKIGMTQLFDEKERLLPVTVLKIGPCYITQIKQKTKEGYDAIQVGFEEQKVSRISKAELGHCKKANVEPLRHLVEFVPSSDSDYQLGNKLSVECFAEGIKVDVIGKAKGRGFLGVVARYGFSGGPASHGSMFHRRGGSFGMREEPGKIYKGRKMPGHHGNHQITVQNLKVVRILADKNLLLLEGSVPGARNSLVYVRHAIKGKW